MSTPDLDRLRRVLGGEDLRWLVDRMWSRLARDLPLDGDVTLRAATPAQRQAVARLLGRAPGRGTSLTVPLPAVAETLRRAGIAPDLRTAVEALRGPVVNRVAEREAAERAWAAAIEPAEAAARLRPALRSWADWLRQTGIVRRLAGADAARGRALVENAVAVLDRLPASGVPLSVLAATATGDGHALDHGRPLATLVLRAAAALGGMPAGGDAEWRRAVWASVGVLHGELTNPVLVLNVPGDAKTATGRALAVWAEAGQPVHLTARQLLRDAPEPPVAGRRVFVCENTSVVAAAADRLGAAAAPLVCVESHPGAAATLLLRILLARGATLHYHGDFDWAGLVIANGVLARFAARPWRMSAGDYLAAAAPGGRSLRGDPVVASWDPALHEAMQARGWRSRRRSSSTTCYAILLRSGSPR
ncbi:TIGR02679 family protein [Carbonactinospora thermoautotrophica]|uniref:TIGR02679 family protein n=1 Tax=Carbonactinospora thermoautotrophica TaxID=1469144 RepID=UPI00226E5963|nr:TIGR02679 family protein [Carbonactinospora thermoautotrophica]